MLTRKLHRWISVFVFVPLVFFLFTGTVIQLKSWLPGLSPPTQASSDRNTALTQTWSIDELTRLAQSAAPDHFHSTTDLKAIDIRPASGIARLRTLDHTEIQIDLANRSVLQVAPRKVTWWIALHEGALTGEWIRYGLLIPAALLSIVLSITGLMIFLRKYL